MEVCRDRIGLLPPQIFSLWTCSMCYAYLFRKKGILVPNRIVENPRLLYENGNETLSFVPDVFNETSVSHVCSTLSEEGCVRWTACCKAAIVCCQQQVARVARVSQDTEDTCPPTWDGFACFNATPSGSDAVIMCPAYIEEAEITATATKTCTADGQWWRDNKTLQEWTDYTNCVHLHNYKTLFYVGVICNILSLALLVPACAIFLIYRPLRRQQRIKIHVNLFLSFILTNIFMLLWEHLVNYNRITTPDEDTFLRQNTLECKVLYVLRRYSWTCNFLWMFLEGFHLHRLIVSAFKVPRSILIYYFAGWCVPAVPVLLYTVIRVIREDRICWVENAGMFEWIVYVPNLLCILANLFFLGSILKILLTQLQSHPNEPSSYRRALKATFVLIPLFGLQLFLIIYRPSSDNYFTQIYEVLAKVVTNAQGAVVALLFCFFNSEVLAYLRLCLPECKRDPVISELARSNSFSTQYVVDSSRRKDTATKLEKKDYILLKYMKNTKYQSNGNV